MSQVRAAAALLVLAARLDTMSDGTHTNESWNTLL